LIQANKLGERRDAKRGMDDQGKLRGSDEPDRREVARRVIRQRLVNAWADRQRRDRREQDGVAVRRCARGGLRGNDGAGARAIFHDHRPLEFLLQLLRKEARENVGAAAGGKRA